MIIDDIYDDHVELNNMGRTRTVKTETCIITFKCTDPYGFWYVSLDKGQLPEYLRGAYSTFDKAFKDVDRYVREKRLTIVAQSDNEEANPIDRESLIPVLKTKKVKSA